MNIFLNQVQITLPKGAETTLTSLLSIQGIKAEGIAVAINNRIIMRNNWAVTQLCEGDRVTVIQATYGG